MVIRCLLNAVVAAVPTSVPAVLVFSLSRCGLILRPQDIHVHISTKVKTAAAVEVVVFDKTGTLTGSIVRTPSPA